MAIFNSYVKLPEGIGNHSKWRFPLSHEATLNSSKPWTTMTQYWNPLGEDPRLTNFSLIFFKSKTMNRPAGRFKVSTRYMLMPQWIRCVRDDPGWGKLVQPVLGESPRLWSLQFGGVWQPYSGAPCCFFWCLPLSLYSCRPSDQNQGNGPEKCQEAMHVAVDVWQIVSENGIYPASSNLIRKMIIHDSKFSRIFGAPMYTK